MAMVQRKKSRDLRIGDLNGSFIAKSYRDESGRQRRPDEAQSLVLQAVIESVWPKPPRKQHHRQGLSLDMTVINAGSPPTVRWRAV